MLLLGCLNFKNLKININNQLVNFKALQFYTIWYKIEARGGFKQNL